MVSPKPCDINHLLQSLGGNRLAVEKLVRIFLDMYPAKIALFDNALQTADWVSLGRVVHDLRGTCAILSASDCLVLAAKLENALPEHVTPDLMVECARFKTALTEVVAAIHLFLSDPIDAAHGCQDAT